MRTLIEIPDTDIKALDLLRQQRGESRSKLVRRAVREYLERNLQPEPERAFGLWRDRDDDGLDYQRKLRAEW